MRKKAQLTWWLPLRCPKQVSCEEPGPLSPRPHPPRLPPSLRPHCRPHLRCSPTLSGSPPGGESCPTWLGPGTMAGGEVSVRVIHTWGSFLPSRPQAAAVGGGKGRAFGIWTELRLHILTFRFHKIKMNLSYSTLWLRWTAWFVPSPPPAPNSSHSLSGYSHPPASESRQLVPRRSEEDRAMARQPLFKSEVRGSDATRVQDSWVVGQGRTLSSNQSSHAPHLVPGPDPWVPHPGRNMSTCKHI